MVSLQQLAFIKCRQIIDVSLIANEFLDHRARQGLCAIICKVDIEKAFDHVKLKLPSFSIGEYGLSA